MTDTSYRLASITAIDSGGVSVQFEGENTASDKAYTVVQSYYPTLGDRVVMLNISGTYIVLGSVGAPVASVDYIPAAEKGAAGGVATLNSGGQVEQKAVSAVSADSATNANHATSADSADSADHADESTNFTGKHTGSYLAFFGKTTSVGRTSISTLSTSADLADVITKVNSIINAGKNYGLYG
nr:MAG TPA: hypothetical protein [Caudoviricetes sp.]